ncbi:Histone-lysine N-methyltransferase SETMAR, partial [Habropoda laboriosa]
LSRFDILFHRDNVRQHASKTTIERIKQLQRPPYSPDLTPFDYHLLHNFFTCKNFQNADHLKSILDQFFNSTDKNFFEKRIKPLPIK